MKNYRQKKLFSLSSEGNLMVGGEEIVSEDIPEAVWEALKKLYAKSPKKSEILEAAKMIFPGRFKCTGCGECCRHISKILPDFDLGDGVCCHLDPSGKCDIYETRPLICRVEDFWEKCLRGKISKEDWYETNYKSCDDLKKFLPPTQDTEN